MTAVEPVWLPADMTCMRCGANRALPQGLFCTPCNEFAELFSEDNHPARLLGLAQQAIRTALATNDIDQIKTGLRDVLAELMKTEVAA